MILLNMIVKNEAHVIERCLKSVKPLIDAAVIVDTGSTDGTPELIRKTLCDRVNVVLHRPWVNFGYNRTQALACAQAYCTLPYDYALLLDADEEVETDLKYMTPGLRAPLYGAWHETPGGGRYVRPFLLQAGLPWAWQGVLHEELLCNGKALTGKVLDKVTVVDHCDSARNQVPLDQKYLADAAVLLAAPRTPRNVFYLAQSYRDAGRLEHALGIYLLRSLMTGFDEETWYAWYQAAWMKQCLGYPHDQVRQAYMDAFNKRPSRAEPLRRLHTYLLNRGCYRDADKVQTLLAGIPMTTDTLFVEPYAYGR